MLSFSQFNEMAERSNERAVKLLNYIHKKQIKKGMIPKKDAIINHQALNLVKRVGDRPYNVNYNDFNYTGEIRDVPVHTLVTGQQHFSVQVAAKKIRGEWKDHDPEIPYVAQHRGIHYMIDGNHRANEAKLKGLKTIKAKVIDVPDDDERRLTYTKPRQVSE